MPPCPECNTELIETLPWVEGVIVEDPATAALHVHRVVISLCQVPQ